VTELLPPLAADDLAAFSVVSDAQISPDGTRVAYPVRRMDLAGNRYRAEIHVVPFDGDVDGQPITAGDADVSAPRWSPDGRTIAHLSAGVPPAEPGAAKPPRQLHLVSAVGGASRRLGDPLDDCSEPAWAPDGSGLVVVVKEPADPSHAADAIRVYDRIRYKSDEGGLLDLRRKHLWWVPLDGAPRRLTDGDWDDTEPAFSPDGSEIAFVSNRSGERDRNTVADLWVVDREGGETRRITDERGAYGNPSWSPDGRSITGYGVGRAVGSQAANGSAVALPRDRRRRRPGHRPPRRVGPHRRLDGHRRHPRPDRHAPADLEPGRPARIFRRLRSGHREPLLLRGDGRRRPRGDRWRAPGRQRLDRRRGAPLRRGRRDRRRPGRGREPGRSTRPIFAGSPG